MAGADGVRNFAGGEVEGAKMRLERHLHIEHADVDALAASGTGPFVEGGEHTECERSAICMRRVPPPTSPMGKPMYTGSSPGLPVTLMAPPRACTTPSKAGRAAYGPSCPNPESDAEMMRGL